MCVEDVGDVRLVGPVHVVGQHIVPEVCIVPIVRVRRVVICATLGPIERTIL